MPRPAAKPIGSPLPTAPLIVTPHEAQIIAALRKHDTISRTDIARLTGWSRPKVTTEVGKLAKRGILIDSGEGASQGGRRPRLLRFNHQLGYIVGVDIGATSMDLAIADLNAQVLARDCGPADVRDEPLVLLGEVKRRVLALLTKHDIRPERVLGVGVGVPGPVDFLKGVLVAPPLMPTWEGFSIRGYFHPIFPSAFVAVDNDVNIMALGELKSGAGMGQEDFIFVKIGTGIGAGIVCNGIIHRGHNGSAGDIGHICADHHGPICRCGNVGCLEAMAAGPAIAHRAVEAAQNGSSPILAQKLAANGSLRSEDVGAAVREGDRAAIEIVQQCGQLIGDVLAGLVNFFNPSMILVGGGVSNIGNQLLASIRQAVLHRSTALATRELIVSYSPMSSEAGVTGAIHLALEHLFVVQDKSVGA
jgi:glucokinase-like ROK family protein